MSRPDSTILDRLHRHAQDQPDRAAFTFLHDNGTTDAWSFRQLEQRVHTLAAQFAQQAEPGERALLLYPPGLEFIAAFLGCLYAGIVAVPAPIPRKNRSNFRLQSILQNAAPLLILTTSDIAPIISTEFAQVGTHIRLVVTDEITTDPPDLWQVPLLQENTLALLQYTSGSTGTPRGVMVSHANLMHNLRAIEQACQHTRDTVGVGWLPMFHDMGLLGYVLSPLYVGFPCVLFSPGSFLREPVRWLRAITHYKGTYGGAPNFAYDHCVRLVQAEEKHDLDLSSWVLAFNGSEPIRTETLDQFTKAFADCGFRREAFWPCYGLAEATLLVSGGPPSRLPCRVRMSGPALEEHRLELASADNSNARTLVGCGQLGEGIQVTIVDPATGSACPPGKVGEVWTSSGSVAHGYWHRPNETRETFQAYLTGSGAGPFLRTGDAGFLRDGELFITGRLKDLIIIRGRNLYPQDVEAVVERVVDFVQPNACAAFGIEVDGEEWLALVGRVRQAIGDEFEVPVHAVAFVRPGTFPRTSSGKVQRRACRDALLSQQLDLVHSWQASSSRLEPPRGMTSGEPPASMHHASSDLRRVIHDKLLQWLRAEVDTNLTTIAYDTPFSSLGLDSVGVASIGMELEQVISTSLMPELFYEYPTINQLARYLEAQLVAVNRQGQSEPGQAAQTEATQHSEVPYFPGRSLTQTPSSAHQERPAQGRKHRSDAHLRYYAERNQLFDQLKSRDQYFFEATFSAYDGSRIQVDGHRMMMFSSYNYLALIGHAEVNQAAKDAIDAFGTGAHGARLIAGTTTLHRQLERQLADFLHAEEAVVFNTGYVTNLATIHALVGKDDCVIVDEFSHTSVMDGCRLSGASFLLFRHNDISFLEQQLRQAYGRRTLVVVDGVYSMEGDIAPLPDLVELCDYYGAMLMVDEAHSLGVVGSRGGGVQEHFELSPDAIDLKMGTLSKALSSLGGFIAGKAEIISFLKHHAHGFLFSVALSPPQRVATLQRNAVRFLTGVQALGFQTTATQTPIVPILCGTEEHTLRMTARCREEGLFLVPIFYPAVPMNAPRIRASVTAAHTDEDIDRALDILALVGREVGLIS